MQPRIHESGRLKSFLRRQELLITVLLACVHAVLSVWRVGERVIWLTRDFKPLRIPYETELMIAHEGLILITAVLAVWTAAGCLRLYLGRGKPRVGLLHSAVLARKWLGRVALLAVVAAAAGLTWLAWYYRMSVVLIGSVGLMAAVLLFCCGVRVRFWRNIGRILRDARGGSRDGVTGWLRLQSLIMMLTGLLPVAMVLAEGALAAALTPFVRFFLPLVTTETIRETLHRSSAMYTTDVLRTVCGSLACGMVCLLYTSYRASYGDKPDRPVSIGRSERTAPKRIGDPGRKPWGKGC